jgi:hypothetical protein
MSIACPTLQLQSCCQIESRHVLLIIAVKLLAVTIICNHAVRFIRWREVVGPNASRSWDHHKTGITLLVPAAASNSAFAAATHLTVRKEYWRTHAT